MIRSRERRNRRTRRETQGRTPRDRRDVRTMTGTTVSTGECEIEPAKAAVVERIFREFVSGRPPKQIAKTLNQQGVAGPFGGKWSRSTLYGHAKRGTAS
ncbi:MAG: recombinase family protein [Vicinamibacterales bacterium]